LRTIAEVDSCFVSVERLYKYVMDLDGERQLPGLAVAGTEAGWPQAGRVVFDRVTLKYGADLPPALAEFSLHIKSGEKIGIVGRTGAGKSSIISCLFRFVELDAGRITIDDVDISQIPFKLLRRSLAMVPQDPILFSGTLRSNLDPQS